MLGRIGTFSNATSLMNASLKVQAQMADQQGQEGSGLKSTTFSGISGDAAKLLNISGQSARLTADNTAITNAQALVSSAYSATSNIADLATTIRSELAAANSGSGNGTVTASDAQGWLQTLQTQLNTQVGGTYVFGGQAADAPPVDFSDPDYTPAADPTTPDTSYYQGSDKARTLTTSQGMTINISAPASSPGFEELARALSAIIANPGDAATLKSAYDQVSSAVTDIASTQSTISSQAATLDTLSGSNTDKITALNNLGKTLDGSDLATATVMVTQYQTQLEALYSTISKLSDDSILKYLG